MNEKNYDNIDGLLVKVVLGEASGAEMDEVRDWIALSHDNEHYFNDFKRIWEESRSLTLQSTVSEDDAWNQFTQRVAVQDKAGAFSGEPKDAVLRGQPDTGTPVYDIRPGKSFAWLRVAAVLITLFAGGWLYYQYAGKAGQLLSVYADKQVLTDTLPEGTVVTLNKQSSISYRSRFQGNSRAVELEGEAFFQVAPDKDKPFIVKTGGTLIRVLGTSFNVRTLSGGGVTGHTQTGTPAVEVIVETGMVEISRNGHSIRLKAHEKAVIGSGDIQTVKEENRDGLYNYYRTGQFECNGTPLWRLVEKLNEVYRVNIVIGDDRLRELPLSVTFRDESLDEILEVIRKTFKDSKMTLERKGQEIILK